jgi:hypothetical protein
MAPRILGLGGSLASAAVRTAIEFLERRLGAPS